MEKVLIVGAGLSGYCLANEFIKRESTVTLIDNGYNHSSIVAAGMINPLVFRRMTKSWRVDEFLPAALLFYKTIEEKSESSFLHPITIRRFFSSKQEHDYWKNRENTIEFCDYMSVLTNEDYSIHPHSNQFGSGRVKNAWHINTLNFLPAIKSHLLEKGLTILQNEFNYDQLNPEMGQYLNSSYDLILFAQGYLGVDNPYFNHLPLTQTKGETLTVQLSNLDTSESYNRKCFVLPMANMVYKIGSTYTWNTSDINPTEQGKIDILTNLSTITSEIPKILKHDAGIRPTTIDRRPLIGIHPNYNKLAIFNGLGAKGYLLAPLLSHEFVEALFNKTEMPKECGIINRVKNKDY